MYAYNVYIRGNPKYITADDCVSFRLRKLCTRDHINDYIRMSVSTSCIQTHVLSAMDILLLYVKEHENVSLCVCENLLMGKIVTILLLSHIYNGCIYLSFKIG